MDGILNIYKEKGWTSHDVVAKLRGILKQKKIGHTGTLDPAAEGVLPVCVGKATRVCDLLTDHSKTYRAVLRLGLSTDTQDMTGTVLREKPVTCTEDEVLRCISGFTGAQMQVPPMYSALKVNGQKLCDLARKGIEVERKPREIVIEEILVERLALPEITLLVHCSKGTYIRTLCSDIGDRLGCGGCMKELLRVQVGPFRVEDSVRLSEVAALREENRLSEILRRTDEVFAELPGLLLTEEAERLVRNGNPLYPKLAAACQMIGPGSCPEPDRYAGLSREESVRRNLSSSERAWQSEDSQEVMSANCNQAESANPEFSSCEGAIGRDKAPGVLSANLNPDDNQRPQSEAIAPNDGMRVRIYGSQGEFLAVYGYEAARRSWRAVKMFL